MSEETTVYVAGHPTNTNVFHSNEDCRYLTTSSPNTRDRNLVESWGWTECQHCQGQKPSATHDKRTGLRQQIQSGEVNPDDY